jgi:hypothetical protein
MSYTIGQMVGILRTGSWNTSAEGKFTVTKVNKVRIELTNTGGYTRTFSAKTGHQMGDFPSDRTYIVTEDRYDLHVALKDAEAARKQSINRIKNFATKLTDRGITSDDLAALRALLDNAEKFVLVA